MTVSNVSSTGVQQLWQQVNSILASSQTSGTSETDASAAGTSSGVSVDLSQPGQAFSKLQQLAESDPEKFKTLMTSIADELEEAAESSTDENQTTMLSKIAEDFREAAESGSMAEMGPPPPPPPPASDSATSEQVSAYAQNASKETMDSVMEIVKDVIDSKVISL